MDSKEKYNRAKNNINKSKGFMCPMCESYIQPGFDYCPVCGESPEYGNSISDDNEIIYLFVMFWLVFIAPFASVIATFFSKIGENFLIVASMIALGIIGWIGIAYFKYVLKECRRRNFGELRTMWRLKWSIWVIVWTVISVLHLFGYSVN